MYNSGTASYIVIGRIYFVFVVFCVLKRSPKRNIYDSFVHPGGSCLLSDVGYSIVYLLCVSLYAFAEMGIKSYIITSWCSAVKISFNAVTTNLHVTMALYKEGHDVTNTEMNYWRCNIAT